MKRINCWILFCLLFFLPLNITGQKSLYMEVLPGAAIIIPSKLTVHQEGHNDIVFVARYKVEPLKMPIYYSIRAGLSITECLSAEIEFNHLKLYLVNNPLEIQQFSISHGYNQIWFNILKEFRSFDARIGIGPVIAHPENIIRGQKLSGTGGLFSKGYYIDGITTQLALQKRIFLLKYLFLTVESKMNMSCAKVKVADGFANVSVFSFHALLGIGLVLSG